ncbi:MAG: DUF1116 domain-containing protein [Acidimicrobiia bacterium]|nr:DUF1116 domain-containing protein [Acidimicrobiia bacterium]MDH3397666.1 DUF1116 domain-containing protein [Acidimicrobiia bacterium]MDH5615608.1 DUF1116 domain-containing protein [Acidimicrobiia bacterium]
MSGLERLLETEPVVVTAGVEVLAGALEAQSVEVRRTEWSPPAAGTEAALALLAASPEVAEANEVAIARLLEVRPHLVDVVPAARVIPALTERTFLHAGPPLAWADASGPMRGALMGAMLYEGWADSPEDAVSKLEAGEVELAPCHHHQSAGPMAGVISPSMPVLVVQDPDTGGVAYSTLNEGLGKVLRYGAYAPEVIERLRWMERVLGPIVGDVLRRRGPVDVRSLIAQALQMGDDGHNRNRAGTSLLLRTIGAALVESDIAPVADRSVVYSFIDSNDHFMLNLVMAAGKLIVDAASGVEHSSLVTTMARNGTEFGIRLSGTGDRWFTAPAPLVDGLFLGSFTAADANPDIGDSAITETIGLGGFAMAASPAIVGFVGGTASAAVQRTLAMYEITMAEHPSYQIPILEFRGTPTGIDAILVARTGVRPQINTGVAGKVAGVGMVGAGLVEAPMRCFVDAVNALAGGVAGI